MNYQIIDLTDYSLLPFDGYSSFNIKDCKRVFNGISKKIRLDYQIVKDVKPNFYYPKWKQTYSIRKKEVQE